MQDTILAIDGGQTSTDVWLGSAQANVAFLRKAPGFHYSTEPMTHEQPDQLQGIQTAVVALLDEAGCRPDVVQAVCCSLSGWPAGLHEFLQQTFPRAPIRFVEDREAAYAGSLWKTPGVALVGGTGTVALGYDGQRWLAVGGWGYLFGDAGGGWGISQQALIAAIAASEKRGPDSLLPERLLTLFNMPSLRDLAWAVYEGRLMRRDIARATPLVFELAEAGDAGALSVIHEAAAEHTGLIDSLVTQLDLVLPIPIGYTGGVLAKNPFLIGLIRSQLTERGITVDSWRPGSALAGSALLALEAAGVSVTDSVMARIQRLTS